MPIRESECRDEKCRRFGLRTEWFAKTQQSEDPGCPSCGGPRTPLMSTFAVVFTGPITVRYNDKSKEGAHKEGHWAFPRRREDGTVPPAEFISTFEEQRAFCKRNGFARPDEMPTNAEISDDGKRLVRGMPGQEV